MLGVVCVTQGVYSYHLQSNQIQSKNKVVVEHMFQTDWNVLVEFFTCTVHRDSTALMSRAEHRNKMPIKFHNSKQENSIQPICIVLGNGCSGQQMRLIVPVNYAISSRKTRKMEKYMVLMIWRLEIV